MKTVTQNTQGAKNAPKVEIEIKTPASADVEIKAESTPAPKSKKATTKKDMPKAEPKPGAKVEPEKVDVSKVAPLVVPKDLLTAKLSALDKKLEKEKRTTTAAGYHVAFGYFLCKAKSGRVLTIQYHETLRPAKWLVRDDKGKILTTAPIATLWEAHQTAVEL